MQALAFVSLLLFASSVHGFLQPCSVTLETISGDIAKANLQRAFCERAYFTGAACDGYWSAQAQTLADTTTHAQCLEDTELDFIHYLAGYGNGTVGAVETQGNFTRTTINNDASATQLFVLQQNNETRNTISVQEHHTRYVLGSLINTTSDEIRANTTAEALHTRALIALEASLTRANVSNESASTRATVSSEAAQTRADVDAQGNHTRVLVRHETQATQELISYQAQATRDFVFAQHNQTRNLTKLETHATIIEIRAQEEYTRSAVASDVTALTINLTQVIDQDGASTRANVSAEAANTRTTVETNAEATRAAIDADGAATRANLTAVVNADGAATRTFIATQEAATQAVIAENAAATQHVVSTSANTTNNLIASSTSAIESSIGVIQTNQSSFVTLYLTVQLELACAGGLRVDLFQRPAADGGYYELFRSVVGDVCTYNNQKYGDQGEEGNLASADSKASQKSYRLAWTYLCNAYAGCATPSIYG